jgi:cytidylate kinase
VANKIALSGKSGSGKTTIANYLVEKHGFIRCGTGEACRDVCKRLFGTDSKAVLNKVTDAMKVVDPDVWLKAALSSGEAEKPIVFDSMRFTNDYVYLEQQGFTMWRIEAPLDIRLQRMEERNQIVTPEDDEHSTEKELDAHRFDQIINNSAPGLAMLYEKIEEALARGPSS